MIRMELEIMGFQPQNMMEIRSKDGVRIFRFESGDARLVVKYFEREPDRRELENYRLLSELGLETLPVVAQTDRALVLPDLNWDSAYRLGEEADLKDPQVAAALGRWYRKLHRAGKSYVRDHGDGLYDEADLLTLNNLEQVKKRTQTGEERFWDVLFHSFPRFCEKVRETPKTLTYNDFYYTNLVVARDRTTAFPFDYNLMGKGCVLADLRNVTYYMDESAKAAFFDAYGAVKAQDRQYDAIVSPLVTLVFACRAETMPDWAEEELEKLRSGELLRNLNRFLDDGPQIVPVSGDNLADAAEVHAASWRESHKNICSSEFVAAHTVQRQAVYLEGEMDRGKQLFLLTDQVPVGVVSVDRDVIENLYVHPAHWRKGYGTKLLRFAETKCKTPRLWVLNTNEQARRFYEARGYALTGREKVLSQTLKELELERTDLGFIE